MNLPIESLDMTSLCIDFTSLAVWIMLNSVVLSIQPVEYQKHSSIAPLPSIITPNNAIRVPES